VVNTSVAKSFDRSVVLVIIKLSKPSIIAIIARETILIVSIYSTVDCPRLFIFAPNRTAPSVMFYKRTATTLRPMYHSTRQNDIGFPN